MDDERFDRMISRFARSGSRRGALGFLTAAMGVAGLTLLGQDAADAKKKKSGKKKKRRRRSGSGSPPPPPASPPPPVSPPPPPGPTKGLQEVCTPGVDTCAAGLQCGTPTTKHQCSSTVGDTKSWCCVPPGGNCTGECGCCGAYQCEYVMGNTGTCRPL